MNNRIRYNANEVQRNIFYQFPKFLMHNEEFSDLSAQAKLLYMVLRDRHELSLKNKWIDEENNIFLICSREEMQKLLKVSNKTIAKVMAELKKYNLIDEQRRGQGNVNYIYLLTLETLENTETCTFYTSKNELNTRQEMKEVHANNTYLNKNYQSDTEYHIQSNQSVLKGQKEKTDSIRADKTAPIQSVENEKESFENATVTSDKHFKPSKPLYSLPELEEIIKDNISYDILVSDYRISQDTLDEIVFIMTSTIMTEFSDGYITMGEEKVPQEVVKSTFMKLTAEHISMFVDDYNKQTLTISKTTPYIRKSLYKTYGGLSHRYSNMVHVDMPYMAKPKKRPNELDPIEQRN